MQKNKQKEHLNKQIKLIKEKDMQYQQKKQKNH